MSAAYPARQIIRCPLCPIGALPAHIGNGVMVCQSCGSAFRVVHAEQGKTGARLGRIVKDSMAWRQ